MTGWKTFKGVIITEVFQGVSAFSNHFRIVLERRRTDEDGLGNRYSEINIQDSQLKEKLQRLLNGESSREYFAYGMTNIDVFNRGGSFVIDHSPFDGCHDEYVLKKGEMERLIKLLTLSVQKEEGLQNLVERMIHELNSARNSQEAISATAWNEELLKLGIKEQIIENSIIIVK